MPLPLAPGQRVVDKDGFRATVKYVGPVASSRNPDAVFAGVEWDLASRGKGDGSVLSAADGSAVRYFQAATPTGASFVRPDLLSPGQPCDAALDERYNDKAAYEGATLVFRMLRDNRLVLVPTDLR